MKKGRLGRLAQLGGMAVGVAGDLARAQLSERFHEQAAQRLERVLGEMKGLPLKAGQLLSYIDDAVPEDQRAVYQGVLGRLQARTPTVPYERMQALLIEELGAPPEELFERFETEPIAAASIGQVYAAVLEGQDVVVKVQYPGIAEAIESDLQNVESLVGAFSAVLPRTDVRPFVEDAVSRITEELDYELEARHQEQFRSIWSGAPDVRIPATIPGLCRPRVLVSERLPGRSWQDIQSAPEAGYGSTIWRFVFGSLHAHGVFNADPHPGNYLFEPGAVGFLDFGCVQRFPMEVADAMAALRVGFVEGASSSDLRELADTAMGLPELDDELWGLFEGYLRLTMEPMMAPQPYRFTRAYTARLTRLGLEAKQLAIKKALRHGIQATRTPGLVFMGRINFGLSSILAQLGAEADWPSVLESTLSELQSPIT